MNSLRQKPPTAADQTVYTEHGPLRLPMDLREWVPQETLVTWMNEELANLDKTVPEARDYLAFAQKGRAKVMLSVLVLAYATQTFISEDIARLCQSDKTFQDLCEGGPPFRQELQQFRRKNRALLEHALSAVLIRAARERYSNLGKLPPGMEYSLLCRAVDRLDTARHMDTWDE